LHTDTDKDPTKLAFDLMTLGLATKDDRNKLQTYVDTNLQVWLGILPHTSIRHAPTHSA
jgi:hypothetical protein